MEPFSFTAAALVVGNVLAGSWVAAREVVAYRCYKKAVRENDFPSDERISRLGYDDREDYLAGQCAGARRDGVYQVADKLACTTMVILLTVLPVELGVMQYQHSHSAKEKALAPVPSR